MSSDLFSSVITPLVDSGVQSFHFAQVNVVNKPEKPVVSTTDKGVERARITGKVPYFNPRFGETSTVLVMVETQDPDMVEQIRAMNLAKGSQLVVAGTTTGFPVPAGKDKDGAQRWDEKPAISPVMIYDRNTGATAWLPSSHGPTTGMPTEPPAENTADGQAAEATPAEEAAEATAPPAKSKRRREAA